MILRWCLALLLALLPARAVLGAGEPDPIPAVHLFTYQMGETPELLSSVPCSEGNAGCRAGFAAAGPGDELYFFDYYNNNIKVIALGTGALIRLIDGPTGLVSGGPWYKFAYGHPADIVVASNGGIVLLVDHGGIADAVYRFYRLAPRDTTWVPAVAVPKCHRSLISGHSGTLQNRPHRASV